MKHKMLPLLLALVLCMTMVTVPAFAMGDDPDYIVTTPTETRPVQTSVQVTTPQGTIPAATETAATQPTIAANGTGFSEDGILATRDLLYDKATNKQYIVVETRTGETFYMVIDYDKPLDEDEERYQTYFLNPVDIADLLAMMGTEETQPPVCSCTVRCAIGSVNTDCELCTMNIGKCVGAAPLPTETEPPTTEPPVNPKEESNARSVFAALLVLCAAGGIAYYYVIRPRMEDKSKGSTNLDEYDFGLEDEDYAEFEKSEEDEK